MKKAILSIIIFFLPAIALANGSPINVSDFHGVGNITMMEFRDISLEEENLWVEIDGDYANVRVEYKLKNTGSATKVTYGFPLDLVINEYGEGEDENSAREQDIQFNIQDNHGKLKLAVHTEPSPGDSNRVVSDDSMEFQIERKWFTTEIEFKANESKTIIVTYRLKSWLDDWAFSKSFKPAFSDRKFLYMLQPSKNWGDGVVKKFTATIDLNKLLGIGGVVKGVSPKNYRQKNGILEWHIMNFDLKNAEDITLIYDNTTSRMTEYIAENRMPKSLIVKCAASSVLPTEGVNKFNYGPDNLFDNNYDTAWVEGAEGHGIGEWIEVELDGVSIEGIGIINGYTKKKTLYYANSRIKTLRLDVEWDNWGGREGGTDTAELTLKEKEFNELNRNANAPFVSWLADFGDGYNRAKKVRLTILDVYPGTKYEDTPITELFILGNKFEE